MVSERDVLYDEGLNGKVVWFFLRIWGVWVIVGVESLGCE